MTCSRPSPSSGRMRNPTSAKTSDAGLSRQHLGRPERRWRAANAGDLAQRFNQVNVLLHGIGAAGAFEAIPSLPFGAPHHVAEAGFLVGVVANAGLLVESINFE